jgi:hypothetical protein
MKRRINTSAIENVIDLISSMGIYFAINTCLRNKIVSKSEIVSNIGKTKNEFISMIDGIPVDIINEFNEASDKEYGENNGYLGKCVATTQAGTRCRGQAIERNYLWDINLFIESKLNPNMRRCKIHQIEVLNEK